MNGTAGSGGAPKPTSWRRRVDFEILLDGIPALVFICDTGGACVFANAEVQKATGLSEDEWLGGGWISAIHRDDRIRVARAWGRAISASEPFELEYRIRTASGDHDWYLVRARPVRENRRIVHWIGHATDVDDRRRESEVHAARLTAEAERKESERRQVEEFAARLIEANADCIQTLSLDGRLLTINAAGSAAISMDLDDVVLGRSWIGRWPTAAGRASAWNAVSDAAKGGIGRFTAPFISATGERRWWNVAITPMRDADGEVQSLLCVSRDVTEGREALERLNLITTTVREGFYQFDWDNWRLLYASPAYEDICGRPEGTFPDDVRAHQRAIHPEDYEVVASAWAQLENGGSRRMEYRITHPDGRIRWVRDLAYPIRNDHGKVTQVVGSVEDITDARQTEDMLRLVTETVREGFYLFDASQGDVLYANPALDKIWGRSFAESSATHFGFLEWVHADDRVRLLNGLKEVRQGQQTRTAFRITRPDGTVRHLRDLCHPIVDRAGRVTHVAGTVEDVTEILKTEEQLKLIAETVQEGFYQTDIATGCSLYSSPGCERILGRSPRILESEPATYLDWVHPDDRGRVEEMMSREREGEPNRIVYRIVRPDGEVRWVRDLNHPVFDAGVPVQTVGTFEDITEIMQAEARAEAASQERYRSIFELAAVGIARVSMDGRIIEANQRFGEILGWPMEELTALTAQQVAHPIDYAKAWDETQALLRREVSSFSVPMRYRTATGEWVRTRLSVSSAYDAEGRHDHFVSVLAPLEDRWPRPMAASA
ncbi:PAS domain-containing protein [Rubellimicrobium arenae]|uniref:PAS domain-containing protein n=1 Tax=Rubellimicrobium arenae TaxID=2817372 RepID=UPI001B311910|nr:PAS domain-containing protein [Rubellimicrobium arenae]